MSGTGGWRNWTGGREGIEVWDEKQRPVPFHPMRAEVKTEVGAGISADGGKVWPCPTF
jgi:hypothetical protein